MDGSLQKKGKYYYAVIRFIDSNGDSRQKWVNTKKEKVSEARVELNSILNKVENEIFTEPVRITFTDFLLEWLNNVEINVIQKTTWENYKLMIEVHINPYFKKCPVPLQKLTSLHLQKYYHLKMTHGRKNGKGGLSSNTVLKHHAMIKTALGYAKRNGFILQNPAENVTLPKKVKYHGNYYTADQIEKLLEVAKGSSVESAIYLASLYGFRRGEVLGLRWQDIDFDRNQLTVNVTRVKYSTGVLTKCPKTESSIRTLPLIPCVKEYLLRLKTSQKEDQLMFGRDYFQSEFICRRHDGTLMYPAFINENFNRILRNNNLPHIRFHDLRHSTASYLLKNGANMKDVQMWLGDSDIGSIMKI